MSDLDRDLLRVDRWTAASLVTAALLLAGIAICTWMAQS